MQRKAAARFDKFIALEWRKSCRDAVLYTLVPDLHAIPLVFLHPMVATTVKITYNNSVYPEPVE